MKTQISLPIIICLSLIWLSPVAGQSPESANLTAVYSDAIDDAIAHCKSKTALRNSRSEKLQRAAALSCMKEAFFKDYKNELIEDMLKADIGTKPYKIQYYLNQKFFSIIHPKYAGLSKSR
jgi:hypothetical protein